MISGVMTALVTPFKTNGELDVEAMDRLVDLGQYLSHSPVTEKFKELENGMEEFDTDGALESLEEISKSLNISLT